MTAKINVLVAIDHVGYNGHLHGAGRVFFNIISRVDRERFDVVPCILRKNDSSILPAAGQDRRIRYLGRKRLDPRTLYDFLKLIRDHRIDVLHLHQYGASIFGRIAGALTGVPVILHAHGVDHSGAWYHQCIDRALAPFTASAIGVSRVALIKRRMEPDRAVLMANAVALEEFQRVPADASRALKRRFGIEPGHWVIGSVTRLWEQKGNKYLLHAAREILDVVPNAYFLLVGTGPLLGELQALARQLGIEQKVIFAGFFEDVPAMLSIFDIKVISSLWEGFPVALLEAMAMGKPIVATRVDGIKEFLDGGDAVYLVPPKDPHGIAERVIYLLQHEEERKRLSMRSLQESRKYSLDVYMKDLERIYQEVARGLVE